MNKCDYCIHVEMCGWRKELEERGCDFFDDGNKWIPVTESMPELGVKVLVQRYKFGEFDIGYYDGYHEREYWQNGTKHTETVPYWWYIGGRLSVKNPIAWIPFGQFTGLMCEDECKDGEAESEDRG